MIATSQFTLKETVLLDLLADGQWHPTNKLWTAFSSKMKSLKEQPDREEMVEALDGLSDREILISGANESYRFFTDRLRAWRLISPTLDHDNPQLKPRFFGGILEDDGWVYAPLKACHLVHFKASDKLTKKELMEYVQEPENMINLDENYLYKIFSKDKTRVYDLIQELKIAKPEYEIRGIRLEANLRRRNLDDFPKRYLSEMCAHYGQFAKVLLRGQMSSVKKHLPEDDDAQQQIYLWVMEAIKRYDDSTSIPFAAYLGTNIRKWVYDLNRKAFGRSIADKELKHSRAINKFRIEEERSPTIKELAEILDLTIEETLKEKEDINTIINLRNQQAIEHDDFEIPLPSESETDANIEAMIEATILSASITTASQLPDDKRNLVGLISMYYHTWGAGATDKKMRSWLKSKNTLQAYEILREAAHKIILETRKNEQNGA